MATIAALTVDLIARTSKFHSGMSKAKRPVDQLRISVERAERTLDQFARTSRRMALWGGAAFAGLVKAGAKMVDLASEAEQLNNVINRTFGHMAADVNQWAEDTGNALGRSTHSMRKYAGYMQALIRPMVATTEQAAEMSMGLAELAIDLAAFYDAEDEEAFNALRSALVGQTMPLKRFGVAMTQATLQAYAHEKGIRKNITAMTEAEKVQLRYQYLIDQTRLTQGTALQEADEYANVVKAVREEFREQAETIGHILKPAYLWVLEQGRELMRWFDRLDDATKTNVAQWALLGGALVGLVAVLGVVGMGIAALMKGLILFGSVLAFVTSPVVIGIALIALAIAGLKVAWDNNLGGIQDKTLAVWAEIQPRLIAFRNILKEKWEWAISVAGDAWGWLTETTWSEKVEDVKGWLVDGWEWTIDTAGDAWKWFTEETALGKKVEELRRKITDSEAWKWTIDVAFPAILEGGQAVIKAVIEAGGEMYDAVKHGLDTGDWGPFWTVASDVWSKGVLIGIALSGAVKGFALVKTAIIAGLGLLPSLGVFGGLGLITVGIQLAEAWATGDYEAFAANLLAALSAALVVGGLTGSIKAGTLAFTVALNLKLGEKISDVIGELDRRLRFIGEEIGWMQFMLRGAPENVDELYENWARRKGYISDPSGIDAITGAAGVPSRVLTDAELTMLAAIAQLEAGVDGVEGMSAVVEVIFNRMATNAELYGGTIEEVIRKAGQFEPVMTGKFDDLLASGNIAAEAVEAVRLALNRLANDAGVTGGATYFANLDIVRQRNANHWMLDPTKMVPTVIIGDHTFGKAGYKSGGYTGNRPIDEVVGVVHGQEIVIPAPAVRKGLPGILEWLGVPGFQSGRLIDVPGLDIARTTVGDMNNLFSQIGQTILDGLSRLFEIIASAIEVVAIALVGEEKVEEVRKVFDSMRTALADFRNALNASGEGDAPNPEKIVSPLIQAFENINWQVPVDNFVNAFSSALEQSENALAAWVGEVTRLVKVQISKNQEGTFQLSLDWETMVQQMANSLATLLGNALGSLFADNYGAGYGQRTDPFPDLAEITSNVNNYEKNLKRYEQLQRNTDLATIAGAAAGAGLGAAIGSVIPGIGTGIGALIGGLLGGLGGRKAAQNSSAKELEQLSEKLQNDFLKLKEVLSTTMQDIAQGLGRAFSAETYEDFVSQFSQSLEQQVQNALITAFMSSEVIRPLLDQLSDAVTMAVLDGTVTASERTTIIGLYEKITSVSSDFYGSLQNLGIATGDAADNMQKLNESLRNVPQGLRIVSNRLEAAGYALGVRALRSDDYESGASVEVHNHFHGEVYGMDDFDRRVKRVTAGTARQASLATNGVG